MKPYSLMSIAGIRIVVDPTWFFVFLLVVASLGGGYLPVVAPHLSAIENWGLGVVAAILLFASVLVHELSHALLARSAGIPVPRIRLFLFGGVSEMTAEPHEPRSEFRIAAAGPAVSLLIAAVAEGAARALEGPEPSGARALVEYLAAANLLLALFNLLPGLPLDGGRMLRAWLWSRHGNLLRATRTAGRSGATIGWGLVALGFATLLFQNYLGGLWFVILGLFLGRAATTTTEAALLRDSLSGVRVRQLMTREVAAVPAHASLEEMVREIALRRPHSVYPVLNGEEYVGVIGVEQVRRVPRDEWIRTPVRQVMTPAALSPPVAPEDDCLGALERMIREDRQFLAVVQDTKVVGALSRRDILELYRVRAALGPVR
jgi:Zn-dependent protease/CBS domain-containing protein